jgi:hypothetical protein
MYNWAAHEGPYGSQASNNPLNTTIHTAGDEGSFDGTPVQNYATEAEGLAATAETLLSGYPAIVSALRHGVGLSTGNPQVAAELSEWSGGGYSSV